MLRYPHTIFQYAIGNDTHTCFCMLWLIKLNCYYIVPPGCSSSMAFSAEKPNTFDEHFRNFVRHYGKCSADERSLACSRPYKLLSSFEFWYVWNMIKQNGNNRFLFFQNKPAALCNIVRKNVFFLNMHILWVAVYYFSHVACASMFRSRFVLRTFPKGVPSIFYNSKCYGFYYYSIRCNGIQYALFLRTSPRVRPFLREIDEGRQNEKKTHTRQWK